MTPEEREKAAYDSLAQSYNQLVKDYDRAKQELQCALERELRLTRERESVERYRAALIEIGNVLGSPCADNTCQGCRFEMEEAMRIVEKAVLDSDERKT